MDIPSLICQKVIIPVMFGSSETYSILRGIWDSVPRAGQINKHPSQNILFEEGSCKNISEQAALILSDSEINQ